MLRFYFLVITAIFSSGCSTTRLINPNKPLELSKISLAQNHKIQVTLVDGRRFMVSQLQIKPDSTRWFDGKRFLAVATADIKAIRQIQRRNGALQGLAIGLPVGSILGGVIADATYKEPEDPCKTFDFACSLAHGIGNAFDKVGTIIAGIGLGGMVGGIGGALIGDAAGSKSNYQFRASKPGLQCRTSGCESKISYLCNHCHQGWCGDHEKAGNTCRECRKGFLAKYDLAQK